MGPPRALLATLFLGRLSRLIAKEGETRTPQENALINWAILSTYRDCRALGLTEAAHHILRARRPRLQDHA